MSCDAAIRPFPNDTEIRCRGDHEADESHLNVLRDYAYPGSATTIEWEEDDRRTFHGEWPGPCAATPGCVLPNKHRGRCAT